MPSRRRLAHPILLAVLLVAGCGPGSGTTAPGPATPAAPTAAATDVAAASVAPGDGSGQAAQTDTDWGRIWDSLPGGFPRFPGSADGDEAATGPASAVLVAQGADAKAVARFYQDALAAAGYTTDGLSGPLEDGGYVLDMTGAAAGCRLEVTAAPTGGLVTLTILYGAACPAA